MDIKHETKGLWHGLHELYLKLSEQALLTHVSHYLHNTESNKAPNIAVPLSNYIEKLSSLNKQAKSKLRSNFAHRIINHHETAQSSAAQANTNTNTEKCHAPLSAEHTVGPGHHYRIATSKIASDQYMGERMKNSTWSHINASLRKARKGETVNARLHAHIANDALNEAAHYMSAEDYQELCSEVAKAFEALEL